MNEPKAPKMELARRQGMALVLLGLQSHWDKILRADPVKNPYPLAPRDLRRMGVVTPEGYAAQNAAFGDFCSKIMERELPELARSFARVLQPEIKVIGVGLARDLDWIRLGCESGFNITASDISAVAEQKLDRLIDTLPLAHQCQVGFEREDVSHGWIDEDHTVGYYACQLVQVLKPVEMRRLMHGIGRCLVRKPGRTLYLVHPFDEDNRTPRVWGGISFPLGVEWGNTIPYSKEKLLTSLGRAFRQVEVAVLGEHWHWHQLYTFLRIRSTTKR